MTKFERCLAIILREEGGLVRLPGDKGGLTNRGITQATYDHYVASLRLTQHSVALITEDEINEIYFREYWEPSFAELMSWPLCLAHFHFYVNAEPHSAYKVLQRALNVEADGVIGNQTKGMIALLNKSAESIATTSNALLLEQVFFYDSLDEHDPIKTRFLTTLWLARIRHIYRETKKPL